MNTSFLKVKKSNVLITEKTMRVMKIRVMEVTEVDEKKSDEDDY